MSLEEFKFIRKRQQHLMPKSMKEFASELSDKKHPSECNLRKDDYIKSWCIVFTGNDQSIIEVAIKDFSKFNVLQLKTAFEWTIKHFAELDFGGNYKWYEAIGTILKSLANSSWTTETENKLIEYYITDTRWYDF